MESAPSGATLRAGNSSSFMKKAVWCLLSLALTAFFIPNSAIAAVDFSQSIASTTVATVNLGTANGAWLLGSAPTNPSAPAQLVVKISDDGTQQVELGLVCSTSPTSSVGGCTGAWAGAANLKFTPVGGVELTSTPTIYSFSSTTFPAYVSGYYFLQVSRTGIPNAVVSFQGNSTASSTCIAGCVTNTGQPYYVVSSEIINWNAISFPLVFSTSSATIAASSSLWSAFATTTTLTATCTNENIFAQGLCLAGAFLFVPNPNVLNTFSGLQATMAEKFPFSWFMQVREVLDDLAATSTTQTVLSIDMQSVDFASSTPFGSVFGNMELTFSSSTVMTYISPTLWNIGQALIAAALWLALGFDIYHTVRNRHAHV